MQSSKQRFHNGGNVGIGRRLTNNYQVNDSQEDGGANATDQEIYLPQIQTNNNAKNLKMS